MDKLKAQELLRTKGIPCDERQLLRQVKASNTENVGLLLDAGVDPGARDRRGDSAAVLASRAGRKDLVRELLQAGASADDLVDALEKGGRRKDIWEKLASLSAVLTFVSSLVIASIGWWFTQSYNDRQSEIAKSQQTRDAAIKVEQNRIAEMQTIERMIPHLVEDEKSKKAALLAISVLARPELATRMAEVFGGTGSVDALQSMAVASKGQERPLAVSALANIAATGGRETAAAAVAALGTVFSGKEKGLVRIFRDGSELCSGFSMDPSGWIATAAYCLNPSQEEESGLKPSRYTIRAWDGRSLSVSRIVFQNGASAAFLKTDPASVLSLSVAKESPPVGSRVVGIAYAQMIDSRGRPSTDMESKLTAMPGLVEARTPELLAVRFEKNLGGGSGGGPVLNDRGEVACMIYMGDLTRDQCVTAEAIQKQFARTRN